MSRVSVVLGRGGSSNTGLRGASSGVDGKGILGSVHSFKSSKASCSGCSEVKKAIVSGEAGAASSGLDNSLELDFKKSGKSRADVVFRLVAVVIVLAMIGEIGFKDSDGSLEDGRGVGARWEDDRRATSKKSALIRVLAAGIGAGVVSSDRKSWSKSHSDRPARFPSPVATWVSRASTEGITVKVSLVST